VSKFVWRTMSTGKPAKAQRVGWVEDKMAKLKSSHAVLFSGSMRKLKLPEIA